MRLAAGVLAVAILSAGTFGTTASEESRSTEAPIKQQIHVLCRWIDEHGDLLIAPMQTLFDGETATFANSTQSPFVVGLTPVGDGAAQQPSIVVLDEGARVEVAIRGRQPHGASVDVAIEQSKITDVGTKQIIPDKNIIQVPRVALHKKRVFDFLKFGEVLAIPLGEKTTDGTSPHVELAISIGGDANMPANWTSPTEELSRNSADAHGDELFRSLLMSGGARIHWQQVSRWEKAYGHKLYDDLGDLRQVCGFARLWCHCPHRLGLADALQALALVTDDPAVVRRLENSRLGCDWVCSVELWDSPSLMNNVHLLADLPELWNLSVVSKTYDYGLLHYLTRINVLHDLKLSEQYWFVQGQRPADDTTEEGQLEESGFTWCLHHDAPGYATLSLELAQRVFHVYVDEAEAAIPALRAANKWTNVLIIGERDEDVERVAQAKKVVQQSLPNMQVDTFVFTGCRSSNRPATSAQVQPTPALSDDETPKPISPKSTGEIVMGGVTPRIIIQEEEEERLGVLEEQ